MENNYCGSSKQRRDLLKYETDNLGRQLPFDYGKISQLRTLKAACSYFKKDKYFSKLSKNEFDDRSPLLDRFICNDETLRNQNLCGFIIAFTRAGELVYISDSTYEHLGIRSSDVMFTYEKVSDMIHERDAFYIDELDKNFDTYKNGQRFSFYSLWFVSKIKRNEKSLTEYKLIRVSGKYDSKIGLYVATCTQTLSVANRELIANLSAECFTSIQNVMLGFQEVSTSIECLLGYDPLSDNLYNMSLYQLVAPENLQLIKQRHLQILHEKNTKGFLDPIKLLHKNGSFVDCLVNIYYDCKEQIVCKYQMLSGQNMKDYKEYVMNFKQNWELYKLEENTPLTNSSFRIDSSRHQEQPQEAECSNFITTEEPFETKVSAYKRPCDFVTECSQSKKLFKIEYEESNYYFSNFDKLGDFEGIDLNEILQINNIKEDIEKEVTLLSQECFLKNESVLDDDYKFHEHFQNYNKGFCDDRFYHALLEDNDLFHCLQYVQ